MSTEKQIIYGCLWPEGHFGREVAEIFAKQVSKSTNGYIRVQLTPPCADAKLTKAVINGEIQMTSGHAITDYVPEVGLDYLPYLYRDFEHFRRIWTLGSPVSDKIVKFFQKRKIGVEVLGYSLIGFRDTILRNTPIINAGDFKNLRIRVDGSETSVATFKALSANPITIEYHDVKKALVQSNVDAAENTSFNLIYMEWDKECSYISLTEHLALLNVEMVNLNFWDSLSLEDKDIIQNAMNDAVKQFADIASQKRGEAIEKLEKQLQVNSLSPKTRKKLADSVLPMKKEFVEKYGLKKEYEYILSI